MTDSADPGQEDDREALARRLRRLEDLESVRGVLLAYPAAVDGRDLDALRRLFHPDAHLLSRSDVHGRDAVLDYFARFFASGWRDTRHYVANLVVGVDGDEATATSYYHQTAVVDGQSVIGWGTYRDRLARTDEGWRITEKVNHVLAMTPIAAGWAEAPARLL